MKRDPIRLSELKVEALRKSDVGPNIGPDVVAQIRTDLRVVRQSKVGPAAYDVKAGLARFATLAASAAPPSAATGGPSASSGATGSGASSSGAGSTGGASNIAAKSVAAKSAVSKGAAAKGALGLKSATLLKGALASLVLLGSVEVAWTVGKPKAPGEPAPAMTPAVVTAAIVTASATASVTANATATATSTPTTTAPSATATVRADDLGDSKTARLKAEMDQLAQVRGTADPAEALALAERGHATFPHGVFWQEREVLAIRALQRLGRAGDAALRAKAFVARHPESPYAAELGSMSGGALPAPTETPAAPPM